MQRLIEFSQWVGKTFAVWAVVFAVLGYAFPTFFAGQKGLIVPALGMIMFGMGLTLSARDFVEVVRRPLQVLLGVAAQFIIMPLLALLLTKLFSLAPEVALGVILVGCCPGGTSSNVITFLARGDVALSVTITSVTTLLAPVMTPLLLKVYAGTLVDIQAVPMMLAIAKIVLLPILAGLTVHKLLGIKVKPVADILPLISVAGIVLIISVVVGLSHSKIATNGLLIVAVVVLHNLLGYLLGMLTGKLAGLSLRQQRAIMIEVGMQNSALGATLATAYFSGLAALPAALFSVWHNISGALLANVCIRHDARVAAQQS